MEVLVRNTDGFVVVVANADDDAAPILDIGHRPNILDDFHFVVVRAPLPVQALFVLEVFGLGFYLEQFCNVTCEESVLHTRRERCDLSVPSPSAYGVTPLVVNGKRAPVTRR